jgi:uncharacterized protein (DUF4213/DUF364 family)
MSHRMTVNNKPVGASPWNLYDELIEQIPSEVLVRDCCIGVHWTYVEAEASAGMAAPAAMKADITMKANVGLAYTMTGGSAALYEGRLDGLPLRELARLSKSWNWREASIGVAALNAWYTTSERVKALSGVLSPTEFSVGGGTICERAQDDECDQDRECVHDRMHVYDGERDFEPERHIGSDLVRNKLLTDPFCVLREQCRGRKVAVIGHFPGLDALAEVCDLTILERNCRDALDVPDPACEYLLPSQDFVFITGVTVINKTAPRLLELARDARAVLVGPSVIAAEQLFACGADVLAGRVVVDTERAKASVKQGTRFASALQTYLISRNC